MHIQSCLLDTGNPRSIEGVALGERVRLQGKTHLWSDRSVATIDTVIVHYISALNSAPSTPFDLDAILKIFCDVGVSAHYMIQRDGAIYQLVPEEKKAWHAGGSIMPEPDNRKGVNDFSIGIELVATPESGFTAAQYDSLVEVCLDIGRRYGRTLHYFGHEDIAGERAVKMNLRADVKRDPGELFDWDGLRRRIRIVDG
jgi:N-acetyl-anhydromuramyl-L-alanine amidase AmpD